MSERRTIPKVGDDVLVPEYDSPCNIGTVTDVICGEETDGQTYIRIEVEGIVLWEHADLVQPIDRSEIETGGDE